MPGQSPPPMLCTVGCPLKISSSRSFFTRKSVAVSMLQRKFGWLMCGTARSARIASTVFCTVPSNVLSRGAAITRVMPSAFTWTAAFWNPVVTSSPGISRNVESINDASVAGSVKTL